MGFSSNSVIRPVSSLILIHLFDFLYFAAFGVVYCIFLYAASRGRFRWYLLFSCGAGFLCYHQTAGRIVRRLSGRIAALFRALLGFLFYLVSAPILFLHQKASPLRAAVVRLLAVRRTIRLKKRWARSVRLTG